MQSPDGIQLWCPSQSLWSLITEHVPGSEMPKICAALGYSLVDMYKDVHAEVEMWYKMWQASQQGSIGSRAGTPLSLQHGSPLADPPAVKELLRSEVKMLLQTLRERAGRGGRDGEALAFQYKPETVDYALGHLDSCQRRSIDPGDTDTGSRPSSHCSVRSSAEEEIESMRDKLNVTDIDQVVDRLKSVLMEECEELKRLVMHLKGNIKQKCQSRLEKSEPTLAELKELRGAIQTDLELYPSSFAASPSRPSPLPLKQLKNRLSAGHKVSDEPLEALSPTPVLVPRPPPPRYQTKPRPPLSCPNKTSASDKVINSPSLSRAHRRPRSTSASSEPRKIETPIGDRIITSGHADSDSTTLLPKPGSDQILDKTIRDCSVSPEQDSAGLHSRTFTSSPAFQIETQRNSATHDTHQSSPHSIRSPSRKCDSSPQTERRSSPARRLRHINTIPSSSHCEADSNIRKSTDHPAPTRGKSETQNGQQKSTCGGRLVSTTENHSVMNETGSFPGRTDRKTINNGADRNSNGHLGMDKAQQQSLVATCLNPKSIRINRQFCTPPKRTAEGDKSQPKRALETKSELEFISNLHQPVPPQRVPT